MEVNEGSINLCKAANLGQQTQNYVGGIVGLNKPQGSIVKPELNGKTVTGKNMVGGIAADNYGTVTGVSEDSEGKIELRARFTVTERMWAVLQGILTIPPRMRALS